MTEHWVRFVEYILQIVWFGAKIARKLWQNFLCLIEYWGIAPKASDILLKSLLSHIKEGADARIGKNPYLNGIQNPGYAKRHQPYYMEMEQ